MSVIDPWPGEFDPKLAGDLSGAAAIYSHRQPSSEAAAVRDMMTTREVADDLRIKQRKVHDLVKARRIPCTRVTGKWLFPRRPVDVWDNQSAGQPAPRAAGRQALSSGLDKGAHLQRWGMSTYIKDVKNRPGRRHRDKADIELGWT